MPLIRLIALGVLTLAAAPIHAAENPPPGSQSQSHPVINKDGPKTPDAPETPTTVDNGVKTQPPGGVQGANQKIQKTTKKGDKSSIVNKNRQTSDGVVSNMGIKTQVKKTTNQSDKSHSGRK